MPETFPRLSSRLHFIEFCSDHLMNIEIWHCLSVLEDYVYGVISQFKRIRENLEKMKVAFPGVSSRFSSAQVRLDIYYYTLTWDKLEKIFKRFRELMNIVQRTSNAIPNEFKQDFRNLRRRIDHLLAEYHTAVRNEYEHPSLQPKKVGSIMEWGSMFEDKEGNIGVHVGKEQFAIVRKEHVERLKSLWIKLIDICLKHLSDKPSSSELLQLKKQIEDNIEHILDTYVQYRREEKNEEADQIIHQMLMSDLHLTREGMELSQDVKDKFYSILMGTGSKF